MKDGGWFLVEAYRTADPAKATAWLELLRRDEDCVGVRLVRDRTTWPGWLAEAVLLDRGPASHAEDRYRKQLPAEQYADFGMTYQVKGQQS